VQVNHGMIVGLITRIVLNNLDLSIQKKNVLLELLCRLHYCGTLMTTLGVE